MSLKGYKIVNILQDHYIVILRRPGCPVMAYTYSTESLILC